MCILKIQETLLTRIKLVISRTEHIWSVPSINKGRTLSNLEPRHFYFELKEGDYSHKITTKRLKIKGFAYGVKGKNSCISKTHTVGLIGGIFFCFILDFNYGIGRDRNQAIN